MLIGVHCPKAGGNSVISALQIAYQGRIQLEYDESPSAVESPVTFDPVGYFNRRSIIPAGVECIYGHLHINKYRHVANAKRFTILREPIANMISIYWFYRSLPANVGGLVLRYCKENDLSVLDMARIPRYRCLMSETYFGGVDMGCFDLIGRHHRWPETINALSSLSGVTLNNDLRMNVTPKFEERQEMESDANLRSQLSDILRDDLVFYERHAFKHI